MPNVIPRPMRDTPPPWDAPIGSMATARRKGVRPYERPQWIHSAERPSMPRQATAISRNRNTLRNKHRIKVADGETAAVPQTSSPSLVCRIRSAPGGDAHSTAGWPRCSCRWALPEPCFRDFPRRRFSCWRVSFCPGGRPGSTSGCTAVCSSDRFFKTGNSSAAFGGVPKSRRWE